MPYAFQLLEQQQVRVLILDEMDYILVARSVNRLEAIETLKHVSNLAFLSLVLAGTPATRALARLHFQYARRFPVVELRRFETCDQAFCNILTELEAQIQPPRPVGLGDPATHLPALLYKASAGLLGALVPIMQRAYAAVVVDGGVGVLGDPGRLAEEFRKAHDAVGGDDGIDDLFGASHS